MSLFLAPIHQWLFNKIKIMESIEKSILETEFDPHEQLKLMEDLSYKAGPYLPDSPLSDLIDTSNIHGWLQNQIAIVETRQAFLIKELSQKKPSFMEGVKKIYADFGAALGTQESQNNPKVAETLFQLLNNSILEGMPCDRVNHITSKSDSEIIWHTERCVHQVHWEKGGIDVSLYYTLREAFTKAFIRTCNPAFQYHFTFENNTQIHSIIKEDSLMSVTKEMLISEILKVKPNAAPILMQFGMGCIGCPSSQMETLEQAAEIHGIEIEDLLKALNE